MIHWEYREREIPPELYYRVFAAWWQPGKVVGMEGEISKWLPYLQTGFSFYMAVYLLKFFRDVMMDFAKQQALLLSLLGELRSDMAEVARNTPKRHDDEQQHTA